jgi:hypothetical protein
MVMQGISAVNPTRYEGVPPDRIATQSARLQTSRYPDLVGPYNQFVLFVLSLQLLL